MSFTLSPAEQASAEASMVAQFCDRYGVLTRSQTVPDGAGGEREGVAFTRSIRFGVVNQQPATGVEGERTRTVINATLRVALDSDIVEGDTITDTATGEAWTVDGAVARQFLLNLSCTLDREG